MAYSELIKSFSRIRSYMRQFYIYGFRSRSEYTDKSPRSYDNERRRVESWLGDFMSFRQDAGGKNVFLTVDSRSVLSNPLYNAFRAKSFTDFDVTFHFYVLDILSDGQKLSVREIMDEVQERFSILENAELMDESSVRKKLKEYVALGLLKSEKRGRELLYSRNESTVRLDTWRDALAFYQEENPLGVIGSYIQDRCGTGEHPFRFKHHYLLQALDSEILCALLPAIWEKRTVEITLFSQRLRAERQHTVFPVKIFVSAQSGKQYLLAYHYQYQKPVFYRLDLILSVKPGAPEPQAEKYGGWYEAFRKNLWGVALGEDPETEHVEMTIRIEDGEGYVLDRLEREKRCGSIEALDEHTFRFSADVYNAYELMPWIRTFTGRIVSLKSTNRQLVRNFYADLDAMIRMYGGDTDALS